MKFMRQRLKRTERTAHFRSHDVYRAQTYAYYFKESINVCRMHIFLVNLTKCTAH